jgi:hypothetical protein
MKCGSAFLLYDNDSSEAIPHLHVVITDPDYNECVVLVSVTKQRARSDTTTCIAPGEHPFVSVPSVITYAYSKLMLQAQLESLVASGDATVKNDASESIVRRAQQGMRETDRAPRAIQEFFLEWWERHQTGA